MSSGRKRLRHESEFWPSKVQRTDPGPSLPRREIVIGLKDRPWHSAQSPPADDRVSPTRTGVPTSESSSLGRHSNTYQSSSRTGFGNCPNSYTISSRTGFGNCPNSYTISQDNTGGESARRSAMLAVLGGKQGNSLSRGDTDRAKGYSEISQDADILSKGNSPPSPGSPVSESDDEPIMASRGATIPIPPLPRARKTPALKINQLIRANSEDPLVKEKGPIKFKDAVGRKFTFPFHICQTWAGMEELIKQAFIHVDIIGPHVRAGHYDLIGPDGDIILPSVWDKVIQPDWAITMHMWPMDRASIDDRGNAHLPPAPPQFQSRGPAHISASSQSSIPTVRINPSLRGIPKGLSRVVRASPSPPNKRAENSLNPRTIA